MPDILQFDPNRGLGFDPNRGLEFDPGRARGFDPNRDLDFDIHRDLGFGKKGPVFRGFVCPVCGAGVTEDQPRCDQCGAVFDPRAPSAPSKETPSTPTSAPAAEPWRAAQGVATMPPPPPPTHVAPPPPPRAYPPAPKRIDVHNCPYCSARVSTTDEFCWNCGNRVYAGGR